MLSNDEILNMPMNKLLPMMAADKELHDRVIALTAANMVNDLYEPKKSE